MPKECIPSTSRGLPSECDIDSNTDEDSIQIHEVSSSNNNDARSRITTREVSPRLRKPTTILKKPNEAVQNSPSRRKMTRSSSASTVRITRSAGVEKCVPSSSVARSLKSKVAVIIQKQSTANATNGRNHKENISILRKVPIKALVDSAIATPSRARTSEIPSQIDNKLLNQRTLRSQNALTKETANKAIHRTASNQTAVNTIIQQIGRVVAQAKAYPVSTRASNVKTNNNVKNSACKKPTKRLINADSVQIVKSNNSNKLQKSSDPLAQAAAAAVARQSTLRFKVVVAKKSVVEQLQNGAQPSVITRRMRLQQ